MIRSVLKSILFLMLCWGCTDDSDNVDNEYGLKLTISVDQDVVEAGNPFTVRGTIYNVSRQHFSERVILGFELLNDQGIAEYTCILPEADFSQKLVVEPNTPLQQNVEITAMFWARPIDSKFADQTLFDLVPNGIYRLHMFGEVVPENEASTFIYSNEVNVRVDQ